MKEIIFSNYLLFLLVLTRMTGVFLFNPFLGRKCAGHRKSRACVGSAIIITPTLSTKAEISSDIEFVLVILKELLIGYLTGFIISLFVSWVLMAEMVMSSSGLACRRFMTRRAIYQCRLPGTCTTLC